MGRTQSIPLPVETMLVKGLVDKALSTSTFKRSLLATLCLSEVSESLFCVSVCDFFERLRGRSEGHRDSNPFKSSVQPYWRKQMALSPVDKGDDFIKSGMTLISDFASEKYFRQLKRKKYGVPQDRLSRQCGGAGGFDDFVERFEE